MVRIYRAEFSQSLGQFARSSATRTVTRSEVDEKTRVFSRHKIFLVTSTCNRLHGCGIEQSVLDEAIIDMYPDQDRSAATSRSTELSLLSRARRVLKLALEPAPG